SMPSCNTSPGITSNPSGTSGGLKERRSWPRSNEPGRQPLAKIKLSLLFKRRMTRILQALLLESQGEIMQSFVSPGRTSPGEPDWDEIAEGQTCKLFISFWVISDTEPSEPLEVKIAV